jgi:UDP-N-acetyl-D-mannosaminuronic acid dehydrogenase
MFASVGKKVVGVDVDQHAIDTINQGDAHITEPNLAGAVKAAVEKGALRATNIVEPADAFIIAVPTPFKKGSKEPDLTFVEEAVRAIAPVLKRGDLVVLESTSPVGTTEKMVAQLAAARRDLSFPNEMLGEADISIAYCPERVMPGSILAELKTNTRIIGGITRKCGKAAQELYSAFVTADCLIASSSRVAEMTKLAENSFRDVNIAFANELSIICNELDVDVAECISHANLHPRVNILRPGVGVGGHCIAVDPWFIVHSAPDSSRIIQSARLVNQEKTQWVLAQVIREVRDLLSNKKIKTADVSLLGLTYKPDIDDVRESPALEIAAKLAGTLEFNIKIVEPNLASLPEELKDIPKISLTEAAESDVIVILVAHKQFQMADFGDKAKTIDVCGLLNIDRSFYPSR